VRRAICKPLMKSGITASAAQSDSGWIVARLRRITTSSHRYMAEVDGLRFIAIFSVMLFHVYYNVTHAPNVVLAPSNWDFLVRPVTQGFRGVQLFFVISGFILGLPFASHYLIGGPPVNIGKFYLRRLTRLEPPYILALLMIYAAAIMMHNVHVREPGFYTGLPLRLAYAYYLVRKVAPTLDGVTWTLEIEVQFYLLAPLLAKIFKLPTVPRRFALTTAIVGAPLLASAVPRGGASLLAFAQYFLIGFLLADIHCASTGPRRLPAWMFDVLGIGCLMVMLLAPEKPVLLMLLPWVLGGIFIGALRGAGFTSFLRRPLISVLGGMCYSLYLLHNPLLSFVTAKIISNGMSLSQACLRMTVAGMPFVIAAGTAYYILIERPCMIPNWPRIAFQYASAKIGGRNNSNASRSQNSRPTCETGKPLQQRDSP
jgi:peptidoglycan/LPS O-acetylase OafA/YrhL